MLSLNQICCEIQRLQDRVTVLEQTSNVQFLPEITSFDGETDSDLDSISTFGEEVNRLFSFVSEDAGMEGYRVVRLEEGTDAQSLPEITRPKDYDAVTNPKIWRSVL